MIESIRIELLGGLSVWADGQQLVDNAAKINKPWQVFCFLVLNRMVPSAPARMISALWPDEKLSDPGNVLKNTVYALRREFKAATSPKESPILFENGGYICNPHITFEVDVEQFEKACTGGMAAEGEKKVTQLTEAVSMYKGDLLPQLDAEVWVMPLAVYYKKRYSDCVQALCGLLYETRRYSELLAEATAANQVDPMEEEYYLYIFRALYALGMHRVIIPTYHKTARIFSEELGVSPGTEIQEIYRAASEKIDQIEQDIMIIKDDLREVTQDNRPINGPLYCTYDVFKYLFQMVARSSERSGASIVIILLTLQGEEGRLPAAKTLSAAMSQIKALILGGLLRKSDTLARYSKSQFIIMLSIEQTGGTDAVLNRLRQKCEPFLAPHGIKLVLATTELDPLVG